MMPTLYECRALPQGWKRGEMVRQSGPLAGRIETYYVSPDNRTFRSKVQLARYFGDSIDMGSFDYATGEINPLLLKRSKRSRPLNSDFSRSGNNRVTLDPASLVAPIRQTASIFKQPVTLFKTQPDSKAQPKSSNQSSSSITNSEKPKQVFWQKRLSGARATLAPELDVSTIELPRPVKAFVPGLSDKATMVSLATALHHPRNGTTASDLAPVLGQKVANRGDIERNPTAFLDPTQPMVLLPAGVISDEEIRKQEERVRHARRRLEEAISECGI